MSENVIRKDIIEIGFDSDLKVLKDILGDLDGVKKSVNGVGKEKGFDEAKRNAQKFDNQLSKVGKTAGRVAKKVAGITFKATVAGIGACATAIGGLTAKSVQAYGDLEQLQGGVKTLFGAKETNSVKEYAKLVGKSTKDVTKEYNNRLKAEKLVMKNANNGYKTSGLSANEYMETVTTFSASLIQSLGNDTVKSAKLADVAMQDMADNANKMGTDMGMIQNAYSGIARGQYMTLDNLKLGYGGTKSELQRLLKDAGKLTGKKYKISSYADIIEAIHAIQENLGITGTTAKEAHKTIQGSFNAMKASWQNLLPALVEGGDSLDQCINNLVDSVGTFGKNIMPAVEKALGGVGKLIEKSAPLIEKYLPKLIDKLLPPLIKAGTSLFIALVKSLPRMLSIVINEIPNVVRLIGKGIGDAFGEDNFVSKAFGGLANSLEWIRDNIGNIKDVAIGATKAIAGIYVAVKVFKAFKKISSVFSAFGKGGKSIGKYSGMLGSLANMDTKKVLKGIANLAIVVCGLSVLAIVVAGVSKLVSMITDIKSLVVVVSLMGVLGVLGVALTKFAGIAGVIPIPTVLKGIANMGIVLVAFGGLSALLALVAPYISGMSDNGSLIKVVTLMGALGLVGLALTAFAGIAGLIPFPVVISGIANMALVLGAFTALVVAFGALSKIEGFNDFVKSGGDTLALLFEQIGKIGGSLVAGIGEGLSNALPVIGNNLAQFGQNIRPFFDSIRGVDTSGIGEFFKGLSAFMVAGSEGGLLGLIKGKANLSKLGKQLASFSTNAKTFFETVAKLPEEGFSKSKLLFDALATCKGLPKEGGITQWFTGEISWGSIALGLAQLSSEKVVKFFNIVSELPEVCFDKTKKLFDSLATCKGLPKEGGIASWFTGDIAWSSIAYGLGILSGEKVVKFMNMVSELPEICFTNTKLLFNALASCKGLPSEGGIAQWFTGDIAWSSVVYGLGLLSGERARGFFDMVSGLDTACFSNTRLLFNALSSVNGLPKEGGIASWFTGNIAWDSITNYLPKIGDAVNKFYSSISNIDDFSKISKTFSELGKIGDYLGKEGGALNKIKEKVSGSEQTAMEVLGSQLKSFADKTKYFFEQVNGLDISKLNRLWESLKKPSEITTDISKTVTSTVSEIVKTISDMPIKMGDAIRRNSSSFSSATSDMWKKAVTSSVSTANQLVSGGNHILNQFGSDKKLTPWTAYANGTNGHKGGNALVNDGRGAELVQMPNGKSFIPNGRNVLFPNAPKGMKVLNAQKTASLFGKSSPTFRYAEGTGDFDVFSYEKGKDLVNAVVQKFVKINASSYSGDVSKGMVSTSKGAMNPWADKLIDEFGAKGLANYKEGAGVKQWRSTVIRALKMLGQYSEANVKRTLYQMQTESGGNPRAINNWDSNAKKGTPSKGLMQVIDPTFKSYAKAPYNKNIYDPLSNILASMRYAISRYGSLAKAYQGHGYANGGIATKPSVFGEDGAEMAIPLSRGKRKRAVGLWNETGNMLGLSTYSPESSTQTVQNRTENNTYSPVFNLTISGTNDDRTMARKVKAWVAESLEECFESMERRNVAEV